MSIVNIILTENALVYLDNNLKIDDIHSNLSVYLSVVYPYTKYAHVNITFCKKDDISNDDIFLNMYKFDIYIEKKSLSLLNNSVIDFKNNGLCINTNIFKESSLDYLDLKDKIKNLFENEINVILSQHGGFIELVELSQDALVIKFHGGCQGCGMVGYTLNNYIEKMIKKNFPQIKSISDITSHEFKDNAYY